MAGAAVTVASTALDYCVFNPLEKSLEIDNSENIFEIASVSGIFGKKVIAQKH